MFGFEELQISGMQPSLLANKLGLTAKTLSLLFAKIRVAPNGCWEWMGAKRDGYGAIKVRAYSHLTQIAHRVFYQLVHGSLDSSIVLHHKVEDGCMGPACCNPAHLMETTPGVHTSEISPNSISYIARHRDSCENGHLYTIETVRMLKNGTRQCRECDKQKAQAKRDANRVRPKFAKDPSKLKTHCKRGHPLDGDNIKWVNSKWGLQKQCIACIAVRNERYQQEQDLVEAGLFKPIPPGPNQKDVCKNGHAMTGDNIYIRPDGTGRQCKECKLQTVKKHQSAHHEEYLARRAELRRRS